MPLSEELPPLSSEEHDTIANTSAPELANAKIRPSMNTEYHEIEAQEPRHPSSTFTFGFAKVLATWHVSGHRMSLVGFAALS